MEGLAQEECWETSMAGLIERTTILLQEAAECLEMNWTGETYLEKRNYDALKTVCEYFEAGIDPPPW